MAILNNSPELALTEIVTQLFNNKLLADIVFKFENDITIYAHSFLLMSRSVVYEKEFHANQGENKLIPIENYDYDTFYQFVRFIYTDLCDVTVQNVIELLELSVKYKIPKLENVVLAFLLKNQLSFLEKFRIYEFCATQNYQLLRKWIDHKIGPIIPEAIKSDYFMTIEPSVLEEILKMEFVGTADSPFKEVDLFMALIKWMNAYCVKKQISLSERRTKFDKFIRLIRFPFMVLAELTHCIENSDNLFNDSDYVAFFKSDESQGLYNSRSRQLCQPHQQVDYQNACYYKHYTNQKPIYQIFETTEKILITGLWIKSTVSAVCLKTTTSNPNSTILNLNNSQNTDAREAIFNFGESFELIPSHQYQFEIQPLGYTTGESPQNTIDATRDALVHETFVNYFKEVMRDNRVVEIFFKMPENFT